MSIKESRTWALINVTHENTHMHTAMQKHTQTHRHTHPTCIFLLPSYGLRDLPKKGRQRMRKSRHHITQGTPGLLAVVKVQPHDNQRTSIIQ